MVLRFSKAMWFVSLFGALASLLLVYSSLPAEVIVYEDGPIYASLSRDHFFYLVLAFLAIVNLVVFLVAKPFRAQELFRAWANGLVITLNIFFVFSLFFINAYNGAERFNFDRVGVFIYGSLALIVIWALVWPVYAVSKKMLFKSNVL